MVPCPLAAASLLSLVRLYLSDGYSLISRLLPPILPKGGPTLFAILSCTRMFGLLVGFLQWIRVGLPSL